MAKGNAEKFIKEITVNRAFRTSLYKLDSPDDINKYIKELGYHFELYEFEDSINNLKLKSSEEEDAIMLDELLLWWQILMPYVESGSRESACSKCSSCG